MSEPLPSSSSSHSINRSDYSQPFLTPAPNPIELFRSRAIKRTRGCCGLWSCMRHYGFLQYWVFHVLYFLVIGILGTMFIHRNESPISLVDAFFMSFSTVCLGGLSTINMSQLKTGTYIVMIIMMELGGAIFTTVFTLLVRRYFLRRAHREMKSEVTNNPVGAEEISDPYHLLDANLDNNIEYAAMGLLLRIILIYVIVVQGLCAFIVGIYLNTNGRNSLILETITPGLRDGPMNVWLFSIFTSVSAFCNVGLIPLGSSLVNFQEHPAVLIPIMFNIVLGNTAFPMVLRGLVVLYSKLPSTSQKNQFLSNFILTKSRTIYTHLFSATYTRVLVVIFFSLLLVETAMFLITEANNPEIQDITFGYYFLNGLFQSASTRTAGMNTVNLHQLNPGLLVLMILSMYIVTYPLLFAIRRSDTSVKNQLENQFRAQGVAQGIISAPLFHPGQERPSVNWEKEYNVLVSSQTQAQSRQRTISGLDIEQARREMEALSTFEEQLQEEEIKLIKFENSKKLQDNLNDAKNKGFAQKLIKLYTEVLLFRDVAWVYLATLIICLAEGRELTNPYVDPESSIFEVVFEVVSAFGTVGFTLGYKDYPYSFSGTLSSVSKVTLVIVMLLGRHRGLPSSTDPAVIPSNYASLRAFRARRRAFLVRLENKEAEDRKMMEPMIEPGALDSLDDSDELRERSRSPPPTSNDGPSRVSRFLNYLKGGPSGGGNESRETGVVLTPSNANNGFLQALSDDEEVN